MNRRAAPRHAAPRYPLDLQRLDPFHPPQLIIPTLFSTPQRMGYCRTGHVVVATRDDLVGQYVGHTAPKTKEVIKKAMGGVLLIDEAYYLYNAANDRDYGQESIEILLNVMEKQQEDLIVVLAGYKDRMDRFFSVC